jgi:hypothetical protein
MYHDAGVSRVLASGTIDNGKVIQAFIVMTPLTILVM